MECPEEINSVDESGEGIKVAVSKPSTAEVRFQDAVLLVKIINMITYIYNIHVRITYNSINSNSDKNNISNTVIYIYI